jgi:hypothetical protein
MRGNYRKMWTIPWVLEVPHCQPVHDSDSGISVGLMDVHGSIEQSDGTANLRYPARNSILSWLIGRYSYLLQKTS